MKLPNADLAFVEQEKICGYLLNAQHRYGASKAKFFAEFGFSLASWEVLADALREHGQQHEVSKGKEPASARATRSKASWRCRTDAARACAQSGKSIRAKQRRASSPPIPWRNYHDPGT